MNNDSGPYAVETAIFTQLSNIAVANGYRTDAGADVVIDDGYIPDGETPLIVDSGDEEVFRKNGVNGLHCGMTLRVSAVVNGIDLDARRRGYDVLADIKKAIHQIPAAPELMQKPAYRRGGVVAASKEGIAKTVIWAEITTEYDDPAD